MNDQVDVPSGFVNRSTRAPDRIAGAFGTGNHSTLVE